MKERRVIMGLVLFLATLVVLGCGVKGLGAAEDGLELLGVWALDKEANENSLITPEALGSTRLLVPNGLYFDGTTVYHINIEEKKKMGSFAYSVSSSSLVRIKNTDYNYQVSGDKLTLTKDGVKSVYFASNVKPEELKE